MKKLLHDVINMEPQHKLCLGIVYTNIIKMGTFKDPVFGLGPSY